MEIIPEGQKDPWSVHLCAALGLEHVVLFTGVEASDRKAVTIGSRDLDNIYVAFDADIERITSIVDQT